MNDDLSAEIPIGLNQLFYMSSKNVTIIRYEINNSKHSPMLKYWKHELNKSDDIYLLAGYFTP